MTRKAPKPRTKSPPVTKRERAYDKMARAIDAVDDPTPKPRGRKVHTVKCWPEFFEAIASGHKRAELRLDDRDYQVGDHVIEQEWRPGVAADCSYTGREVRVEITHVMRPIPDGIVVGMHPTHPAYEIKQGWCILSIELAGAPSVLVRALDGLVKAARAASTDAPTAVDSPVYGRLDVAIEIAESALGVVTRT